MDIVEQARIRLIIDGKDAKSELTKLEAQITDLRAKQKEHARGTQEYKELNTQIRQLEKSYKLVSERMDINKMTTTQLIKYQRELGRTIKKEMVEGTEEFVTAQAKLTQVNARVKHMNGLLRQSSNELRTQPSMWDKIKVSALAFFAAFSLQRVIDSVRQFARDAFQAVIKMDQMHMALRNVLATNEEYEQSIAFLSRTSDRYGQDLRIITDSYKDFIAASKNTSLSLLEKQRIYESVIKSGAALQMSNADIQGSLKALSQMFSKGNIQAEELRGQLGERLPGAFGIMADALGVNEKQLNKMLEQGEVLAEVALPKFAKALEELYGDKAQNNLQTYDGSWNRLITKLTNWSVAQNENLGITRKLAAGINFVTDNLGLLVKLLVTAVSGIAAYTIALRASSIALGVKNGFLTAGRFLMGQATLARVAMTGSTNAFTFAELRAAAGARTFNAALSANPIGAIILLVTAAVAAYQIYMSQQEKMRAAQAELNNRIGEAVAPLKLQEAEFNRLSKAVLDGNLTLEERQKALDTLKQKYPENLVGINNLKDAEKQLSGVIRSTNADFVTRAKLLENEVRMAYNNELATNAIKDKIRLENELKSASTKGQTMVTGTAGYTHTYDSEAAKIQKLIAAKDALLLKTQENNAKIADSSEAMMKKLNFNYEAEIAGNNKVVTTKKKGLKEKEKALTEHLAKTAKIIAELDKSWIESEKDEVARNKKKLMAKYEDELNNFDKLEASAEEYAAFQINLKEKLVREIADIDKKAWEKQAEGRAKWSGAVQKEVDKVTTETPKMYDAMNEKVAAGAGNLKGRILKYEKEADAARVKSFLDFQEQQKIKEQLIQAGFQLAAQGLNMIEANLDQQLELATTATEKAVILNKKSWLSVADSAMGALDQLARGNVAGAIVGGLGALFGALDNWVHKSANLMAARLEDLREELRIAGEEFMAYAEGFITEDQVAAVNSIYESLIQVAQLPPMRLDFGDIDTYERRIQQELEIGQHIVDNYETAVDKEEAYTEQRKANIDEVYSQEIAAINAKYDLLNTLANQQYSAESQAILENQSDQLLALINNEESKTSVMAEYAQRRSFINQSFALADKEITEDTDQATIDAINAAIAARDKALADLQNWYNDELTFIVNSEGQKRKEYSDTEQIKKDADDRLRELSIKNTAAAIERDRAKNIEIQAAEKRKNDALEVEAKRHNDALVALGVAKDAALAESFTILKNLIANGYDEIMGKALEAFNAGKITAAEYDKIASRLFDIQNLVNNIDWSKITIPQYDGGANLPRFAAGTEYVDPMGVFPSGTDKVPAMLDKGERILDKNKNSLLGGMSNDELVNRALGSFRNTNATLMSKVMNSSISRTGSSVSSPSLRAENNPSRPPQGGEVSMSNDVVTELKDMKVLLSSHLGSIDKTIKDKPVVSTRMISEEARAQAENADRSTFR